MPTSTDYLEASSIITEFLSPKGKCDPHAWDDFVSVTDKNPVINAVKEYCNAVAAIHPPDVSHEYTSPRGAEELASLASALQQGEATTRAWLTARSVPISSTDAPEKPQIDTTNPSSPNTFHTMASDHTPPPPKPVLEDNTNLIPILGIIVGICLLACFFATLFGILFFVQEVASSSVCFTIAAYFLLLGIFTAWMAAVLKHLAALYQNSLKQNALAQQQLEINSQILAQLQTNSSHIRSTP